MSTEDAPIPDEIYPLLEERLGAEPGTLRVSDLTEEFPWAKHHRFIFGFDPHRRAAVCALRDDERAVMLTGERGLAGLSTVLRDERGVIPGGLSPMDLARAVRQLTNAEPMGEVGHEGLLSLNTAPQPGYMAGDALQQTLNRRKFATSPVLQDLGGGTFRLDFFFWNPRGGVEQWAVAGDSQSLQTAQAWQVAPNGSFRWPFV